MERDRGIGEPALTPGSDGIREMPTSRVAAAAGPPATDPLAADHARHASPIPGFPGGRRLGAHLAMGAGMVRAAERAREIGADSLQLFSDNPTAWRRRAELPDELPAFRAKVAELGLGPLAIHAAYLVNLAGPDDDLFERSLAVLTRELAVAPAYGARFVNVHVGSHRGAGIEAGVARVADGVARVLAETPGRSRCGDAGPGELGRRGRRPGHVGRRAGPNPRRDRGAGRGARPGRALPGHRASLGSGCRDRHGRGSGRPGGRGRVPDRPGAGRDDPPQRLEGGVRVAVRPAPAPGGRRDRRATAWHAS